MTVQERVAKGAALLDQKQPGWREKIDPETLNIEFFSHCILGQLSGETMNTGWSDDYEKPRPNKYSSLLSELDVNPYTHGFEAVGSDDTFHDEYVSLTAAWREELARSA